MFPFLFDVHLAFFVHGSFHYSSAMSDLLWLVWTCPSSLAMSGCSCQLVETLQVAVVEVVWAASWGAVEAP